MHQEDVLVPDFKSLVKDRFVWKTIKRKAKQMVGHYGFSRSDEDDLAQELWTTLLQRLPKFNPNRRHLYVFVVTVVERTAASMVRARRAHKRSKICTFTDLRSCSRRGHCPDCERDATIDRPQPSENPNQDLRMALAEAADQLPANLRELFEFLKLFSVTEVSQFTGVPPSTLNDRRKKLLKIFEAAGLRAYLRN